MVPEGKFVDIGDGFQIHYHEAGEGYPVIFIHGSGPGACGWSNFKQNYEVFAKAGYRALLPDTLGFGYSSRPADIDYPFDLVVGAVKRFCDALGIEKCALVGNSLGGAMCIKLALNHPELVEKLILMAPGGLETREVYMGMRGIKRMVRSIYGPEGLSPESMRRVFSLQLFDADKIDDEVIAERFEIAKTQPVKRVIETMKVPNLTEELAGLSCSVLGFWGVDDQFCPVSGATTIAREVKDAKVLLINSCGHWVMVEHTDLFNRMSIEFLGGGE